MPTHTVQREEALGAELFEVDVNWLTPNFFFHNSFTMLLQQLCSQFQCCHRPQILSSLAMDIILARPFEHAKKPSGFPMIVDWH